MLQSLFLCFETRAPRDVVLEKGCAVLLLTFVYVLIVFYAAE